MVGNNYKKFGGGANNRRQLKKVYNRCKQEIVNVEGLQIHSTKLSIFESTLEGLESLSNTALSCFILFL